MAISVRILAGRGLVFVRYSGTLGMAESMEAFAAYAKHPDCRPGQMQLVDLADVDGWDNDFPGLLKMQAIKADTFLGSGREVLFCCHAPREPGREIARMILRSWEDIPGVVAMMQETEAEALSILGQPETSFSQLLQVAG